MLADAFRSEAYRLLKNRTTVFWGFLFAPIGALVVSLAQTAFISQQMTKISTQLPELPLAGAPINLAQTLANGAGGASNALVLLFTLIAAAGLFAADYRWETWRLISARNSRANLLLGKVAVLGAGVAIGVMAMIAAALIGDTIMAIVMKRGVAFDLSADIAGQFAALFALNWARIMQFALLALVAAIATRSLLASLFIPLVIGAAHMMLHNGLPVIGWSAADWQAHLLFPNLSQNVLKAAIMGEPVASDMIIKAVVGFGLWIVAPVAAALALFQRQDLSKE